MKGSRQAAEELLLLSGFAEFRPPLFLRRGDPLTGGRTKLSLTRRCSFCCCRYRSPFAQKRANLPHLFFDSLPLDFEAF